VSRKVAQSPEVTSCLRGQGQIARRRVIKGVWLHDIEEIVTQDGPESMSSGDEETAREMTAVNHLLARLDDGERETLARLLDAQFVSGVHEMLVVLHEHEIPPFDDAYEGTPFHDFIGRLDDWTWPSE
jgi:iron-sulfur cluster repair protein YtfE (RIC family)